MFRNLVVIAAALGTVHGQVRFDKAIKKDWETSKQFALAVAAAMPAEKYGLRPSPEEMPFTALMLHIATSQAFRFAQIAAGRCRSRYPNPFPMDSAKEFVMNLMAKSFDFCIAQLD